MKNRVFISFKNTIDGEVTRDCAIAKELYDALTDKGINTFFAGETFIETGTDQYKERIDRELDTCLILVVVGTTVENINSRWVKYEWDTFFMDILNGKNAKVFTYVDGINPHDLPRALRSVQSFDRNREPLENIVRYIKNAIDDLEDMEPLPDHRTVDKQSAEVLPTAKPSANRQAAEGQPAVTQTVNNPASAAPSTAPPLTTSPAAAPPQAAPPTVAPSKSRSLAVPIAIGLVAVLGILVFVLLKGSGASKPSQSNASISDSTATASESGSTAANDVSTAGNEAAGESNTAVTNNSEAADSAVTDSSDAADSTADGSSNASDSSGVSNSEASDSTAINTSGASDGSNSPAAESAGTDDSIAISNTSTLEINGKRYQLIDANGVTWKEASDWCKNQGGRLAAIKTKEDQTAIELLMQNGKALFYYIGATDENTAENDFRWPDGTAVSDGYTNWGVGCPDNAQINGEYENYIGIVNKDGFYGQARFAWNDFRGDPVDRARGFICEWNEN